MLGGIVGVLVYFVYLYVLVIFRSKNMDLLFDNFILVNELFMEGVDLSILSGLILVLDILVFVNMMLEDFLLVEVLIGVDLVLSFMDNVVGFFGF